MNRIISCIILLFLGCTSVAGLESSCPCVSSSSVFDVTVKVDPAKAPNAKRVALDVFQNVYTAASTFMKKQGLDLKTFKDESNFINEEEPCYHGMLRSGQFKLPEGTALATIEFRLKATDDSLGATVCQCSADDDLGRSVCQKDGM